MHPRMLRSITALISHCRLAVQDRVRGLEVRIGAAAVSTARSSTARSSTARSSTARSSKGVHRQFVPLHNAQSLPVMHSMHHVPSLPPLAARKLTCGTCTHSWLSNQPHAAPGICYRPAPSWQRQRPRMLQVAAYPGSTKTSRARQKKPDGLKIKMHPETREYWEVRLRHLVRSDARELKAMLNLEQVIGVDPDAKGGLPLFAEFCHYKKEYPLHLVLIKIGSFYETVGVDAVMLVEHAGLNAMSKHSGIPRAGFPAGNLTSMLNRLVTENGFSVVVIEQEAGATASKQQLRRYLGGIVTPAKPHYIHGMLQTMGHEVYDVVKPIIGLASTKNGYQVLELRLDSYVLTVHQGLNEEALVAQLYASGVAPPLYVHNSVFQIKHGDNFEERLRSMLVSDIAGSMRKFRGDNVVDSLLTIVRHEHGIDPQVHIQQVKADMGQAPRPLYMSTVNQMGLNSSVKYVPPLLDKIVQLTEKPLNKPSKLWLRRLLLSPPPPHVAAALRRCCHILMTTSRPMPTFLITMPPNQIIDMLTQQEATASFFRDLTDMLDPVRRTVTNPDCKEISQAVLQVVAYDRGLAMTPEAVGDSCQQAIANMAAVIAAEEEEDEALGELSQDDTDGEDSRDEDQEAAGCSSVAVMAQVRRVWERNLRGKIKASLLEEEMREVELTFSEVSTAVRHVLDPMLSYATNHSLKDRETPRCMYDSDVEALRFVIPGNSKLSQQSLRELLKVKLETCKDGRRNARKSERYKSRHVDDVFCNYVEAVHTAQGKVRAVLKDLAQQLYSSLNAQLVAVQFAIILSALTAHVSNATRLGWCLPEADASERGSLVLNGMWPYWWGPEESGEAVRNSITLDSMVLLTGPNMAGKSTVLRTLCAVALLGSCGLMAPAQRAVVPYIDSFVLRNFSGDSPIEKKSAFALEMHEMRFVLEDVTPHSLVLVDELGKGTDHDSGEAISGAILEELDSCGCRGVFATHFHGLVDLKEDGVLTVPNTQLYQMEVDTSSTPDGIETRPTFRMVPGSNSKTLAFSVARNEGLSNTVVQRAYALFNRNTHEGPRSKLTSPDLPLASAAGSSPVTLTATTSTESTAVRQTWDILDDLRPLLQTTTKMVLATQNTAHFFSPLSLGIQPNGVHAEHMNGNSNGHANSGVSSRAGVSNGAGSSNGAVLEQSPSNDGAAPSDYVQDTGVGFDEVPGPSSSAAVKVVKRKRGRPPAQQAQQAVSLDAPPVVLTDLDVDVEVFEVAAGDSPPSAHLARACAYVACWEDGICHVGETEDIIQRHHQHCSRTRRGYKGAMSMLYVVLPLQKGGKSLARQVEAELTRTLRAKGFALKGTGKDAGNTKFARR